MNIYIYIYFFNLLFFFIILETMYSAIEHFVNMALYKCCILLLFLLLEGITRVASALSRWTLWYNLRTVIASQTTAMLRLTADDEDDEYTQ